LHEGLDGPLSLDTQAGDDTVNAIPSTLPLVIFGGEGDDEINSGQGDDILFGDRGRVDYVNDQDEIVTRLGTSIAFIPTEAVGSATADTLTATGATFPTTFDGLEGLVVTLIPKDPETHPFQFRIIESNTANTLTVTENWEVIPTAVDYFYRISFFPEDQTDGVFRDPQVIWTIDPAVGGTDTVTSGGGADIVMGGAFGDFIDGDAGNDLILGDSVQLEGRTADITDPRFRTLSGTQIYSTLASNLAGADLVDDTAQNYRNPDGSVPSWARLQIRNLYHTEALQGAPDNSFGDDYIAGGGHHDVIFGQLGHDTIQGDGSIEFVSAGNYAAIGTLVGATRDPSNALLLNPSFEAATDGDDYIEGNGGNDVVFGGLGQDDIIGGSSNLFTLDAYDERPDGSDLIFGGAGTDAGRSDPGSPNGALVNQFHARDADVILGDNGDIFRLVGINHFDTGFLTFNYDLTSSFEDRGSLRIIPRAARLLDYTPGGPDFTPAV